jgi:hypothetical protein
MFSLDRFYKIIHNNLISPLKNGRSVYFYPFGTYQDRIVLVDKIDNAYTPNNITTDWIKEQEFFHCYFFDQEPIYLTTDPVIRNSVLNLKFIPKLKRINLLANSEKSNIKDDIIKKYGFHDWYYFFHGFAALDWYKDFKYIEPQSFDRFDKVFICYNHLTSNLRSYRLHLVSNLIDQDLIKYGRVSLFHNGWQTTIQDPACPLDTRARVKIYKILKNIKDPLTIDTDIPDGTLSATVNFNDLTSALLHVVTETIYFDPKLHLTEKVFKPIVAKRPFILVAAPGNLAYLKSYGFKTFNRWIDESYDEEPDHYIRIEKITFEIAKLCAMPPALLEQMFQEMQEVLEFNFNHFYTTFKDLIVDELVDNFGNILKQIAIDRNHHLVSPNLEEVKKRLKQ